MSQCERSPWCVRGFKHGGKGGHCSANAALACVAAPSKRPPAPPPPPAVDSSDEAVDSSDDDGRGLYANADRVSGRCLARASTGEWYPAHVLRAEQRSFLVRAAVGDALEWVPAASGRLTTMSAAAAVAHFEETICGLCRELVAEDQLLLCDGCNAGAHTFCLTPPLAAIPDGQWFCGGCEAAIGAAGGDDERAKWTSPMPPPATAAPPPPAAAFRAPLPKAPPPATAAAIGQCPRNAWCMRGAGHGGRGGLCSRRAELGDVAPRIKGASGGGASSGGGALSPSRARRPATTSPPSRGSPKAPSGPSLADVAMVTAEEAVALAIGDDAAGAAFSRAAAAAAAAAFAAAAAEPLPRCEGLPRRSLVAFRVESTRTGGGAALHGAGAGAVLPAEHVQSLVVEGLVAGAAGGAPTLRVRLRPVEVWLSLRRLSAAEAAAATAESAAADAGGGGGLRRAWAGCYWARTEHAWYKLGAPDATHARLWDDGDGARLRACVRVLDACEGAAAEAYIALLERVFAAGVRERDLFGSAAFVHARLSAVISGGGGGGGGTALARCAPLGALLRALQEHAADQPVAAEAEEAEEVPQGEEQDSPPVSELPPASEPSPPAAVSPPPAAESPPPSVGVASPVSDASSSDGATAPADAPAPPTPVEAAEAAEVAEAEAAKAAEAAAAEADDEQDGEAMEVEAAAAAEAAAEAEPEVEAEAEVAEGPPPPAAAAERVYVIRADSVRTLEAPRESALPRCPRSESCALLSGHLGSCAVIRRAVGGRGARRGGRVGVSAADGDAAWVGGQLVVCGIAGWAVGGGADDGGGGGWAGAGTVGAAERRSAEAAAAGCSSDQCERNPLCIRGFKHRGYGGHCKLPEGMGVSHKRDRASVLQRLRDNADSDDAIGMCAAADVTDDEEVEQRRRRRLSGKRVSWAELPPPRTPPSSDDDDDGAAAEGAEPKRPRRACRDASEEEGAALRARADPPLPTPRPLPAPRRIAPTAAAAAAEAAAAGIDTSRCERDPRCVRGWKHRGLGGRCSYNAVSRNGLSNGAPVAAISRLVPATAAAETPPLQNKGRGAGARSGAAQRLEAEALAAGCSPDQCERNPLCMRGYKHRGWGGHCKLRPAPPPAEAPPAVEEAAEEEPAAKMAVEEPAVAPAVHEPSVALDF